MGRIAEESIQKVLEATDIVALIGRYIPVKRAGTSWKACCPFHQEKTPSFSINSVRQSFKCFGCGEGGSAIGFLMKIENIPFVDAVRKLAEIQNIALIEEQSSPEDMRRQRSRMRLVEVCQKTADYFHLLLMKGPQAHQARQYLSERGFGGEMAKRWSIGWAPKQQNDLLKWAEKSLISQQELVEAGVLSASDRVSPYFPFRDRLMFPIHNAYGECIAFSGRVLPHSEDPRKYVNTGETSIFRKGDVIFALDRARKSMGKLGMVLICEGQIDAICCHEAGLEYAVAPLGTAFTPEHAQLLRRYTGHDAKKAVLCYDGDAAGIKAANRAYGILAAAGLDVYLVELPEGDDPDSLIKREGQDAFHQCIQDAKPYLEARIERARKAGLLENTGTVTALARELVELISMIQDSVTRDIAAADVATRLGLSLAELRQSIFRQTRRSNRQQQQQRAFRQGTGDDEPIPAVPMRVHRAIWALCELAMKNAKAQEIICHRVEDLLPSIQQLEGGCLLFKILEKLPVPGQAAMWHSFLLSLPDEERLALQELNTDCDQMSDPENFVLKACSAASRATLMNERERILAQLKSSQLSREDKQVLMARSVEISRLLQ